MSRARSISLLLGLATFAMASPSLAADTRKACLDATEKGQSLRDDGKLSAAREQFAACASDKCPAVIAKECTSWLQKLTDDQPTIAFRAKDSAGKDVIDAQVLVDGTSVTDTIDGKAVNVDPGVHTFKYVHAGSPDVEEKVVVRVGEKNRFVDITFTTTAPTVATTTQPVADEKTSRSGFHVPVLAWVTGAVGLAAFGAMAGLAVSASGDESSLRTSCAPNCAQGDVDAIQTKLVLANVAMGVGIVGLGVALTSVIVANVGGSSTKTGVSRMKWLAGAGWLGLSGSF